MKQFYQESLKETTPATLNGRALQNKCTHTCYSLTLLAQLHYPALKYNFYLRRSTSPLNIG
jgi:hypothetical protein